MSNPQPVSAPTISRSASTNLTMLRRFEISPRSRARLAGVFEALEGFLPRLGRRSCSERLW